MKFSKLIRKDRRRYIPELQLIPFIDILFVLLAFFMMTTSFSDTNSSINIKLPNSSVEQVNVNKVIVISIDDKKQLYLNSTKLDILKLEESIKKELEIQNRKDIIIRADKDTDYGYVVKIMTMAKNAGAAEIDIATEKEE